MKEDIYALIEGLIRFPYSQICVHSVALDLLSILLKHGEVLQDGLAESIIKASGGDVETLCLLSERKRSNIDSKQLCMC